MKHQGAPHHLSRKPVWQLSVVTSREAEDAVSELLASLFLQSAAAYFDCEKNTATCTIYTARRPPAHLTEALYSGLLKIKACGLDLGTGKISLKRLPYRSWAESWKRHFRPITLAGKVLIKPSWNRVKPVAGQSVIVLDPGLSFGTGQHPTTGFCLRQIARLSISPGQRSFLDLGTGSGILAITAAKLGYAPIHALDIDREAIRVAKTNAIRNRVRANLRIDQGDVAQLTLSPRRTYSVICANLMADLLISSRKNILARLAPGGRLIVAGILRKEFDRVHQAFTEAGLRLVAGRSEKEWRSATFASSQAAS